ETLMENIVNHVGMNLDARVIESAKWRGSQITDAGCGGANEDNFSRERTGRGFVFDDVGHRIVRIGVAGAVIVDVNAAEIVRTNLRFVAKNDSVGTHRTKFQGHLIVRKAQERADGLHVE